MSKNRYSKRERVAFGDRLRNAREARGLTQVEASKQLGLRGFTTLSNYEQGRAELPLKLLSEVCRVYRVKIEQLLSDLPPNPEKLALAIRKNDLDIRELTSTLLDQLRELSKQAETIQRRYKQLEEKGA